MAEKWQFEHTYEWQDLPKKTTGLLREQVCRFLRAPPRPASRKIGKEFIRQVMGTCLHPVYDLHILMANSGDMDTPATYGCILTREGVIEFVACGHTYESKEGEFMHGIMSLKTFEEEYKDRGFVGTEETVLQEIRDNKFALSVKSFEDDFDEDSRIPFKIFVMYANRNRGIPIEVNATAAAKLLKKEIDTIKFAQKIKSHTLLIRRRGMKLVPMLLRESSSIGNVRYPAWREEFCSRLVSDMVINYITPNFPIYVNWAFIPGASEAMFENPGVRERYMRSTAANAAQENLKDAQSRIENENAEAFRELEQKIYSAELLAESGLILSDMALLSVMQDVGVTLGSLPHILEPSPSKKLFTDKWLEKLVFDVCYGCTAMQRHLIHGDLHFHNMTVLIQPAKTREGESEMYITGKKEAYVVPICPVQGYIIDFGQAIIMPSDKMKKKLAKQMGPDDLLAFFREQATRMLKLAHRWMPDYAKENQEKIKALGLAEPEKLFAVLRAVDFISIGRNLAQLFRDSQWYRLVKLAETIERTARQEFSKNLRSLVEGKPTSSHAMNPGELVLRKAFAKFSFDRVADDLREAPPGVVFNLHGEEKFSGDAPSTYPPYANMKDLAKILGTTVDELSTPCDYREAQGMNPASSADLEFYTSRAADKLVDAPENPVGGTWL